jgi:hypothetical protein
MRRSTTRSLSLCLCFYIAGCAVATQITNTPRSSIEQKLLVRALERALAGLDASPFKDKTVAVEFHGLTPDQDFAREFFVAWLQSQRVRMAAGARQAQLRLKVFASVLAVDRGQTFIGAPSFTVPIVGFVVPEIPVFRDLRHTGHAEIKVSATDADSGEFIRESPTAIGKARHDDYTILIVGRFTHTDLEKPEWEFGEMTGE